jgi:hypothetical protein
MPNPENLKPFQPGQSGNPAGRPPGRSIKSLKTALKDRLADKPQLVDALVSSLIKQARKGSFPHIKMIFEIIDGPINQPEIEFIDWSALDDEGDTTRPGGQTRVRAGSYDFMPEPPPESLDWLNSDETEKQ